MKFIRIQIYKLWSDHVCLIIHGYIFCGPNYKSTIAINFCLMSADIYGCLVFASNIYIHFYITDIDSLITNRKLVHESFYPSFFSCFHHIFSKQYIWFYFEVFCFELMYIYTISIQKKSWMQSSGGSTKFSFLTK